MLGINHSILFMLGMMLLVLSGFSFLVWNSYRTARRRLKELGVEGPLRLGEEPLEPRT